MYNLEHFLVALCDAHWWWVAYCNLILSMNTYWLYLANTIKHSAVPGIGQTAHCTDVTVPRSYLPLTQRHIVMFRHGKSDPFDAGFVKIFSQLDTVMVPCNRLTLCRLLDTYQYIALHCIAYHEICRWGTWRMHLTTVPAACTASSSHLRGLEHGWRR